MKKYDEYDECYRRGLKTLLEIKSKKPISNNIPNNIIVLLEEFFKHAKTNVRIFCDNFDFMFDDNNEHLIDLIKKAADRDVLLD